MSAGWSYFWCVSHGVIPYVSQRSLGCSALGLTWDSHITPQNLPKPHFPCAECTCFTCPHITCMILDICSHSISNGISQSVTSIDDCCLQPSTSFKSYWFLNKRLSITFPNTFLSMSPVFRCHFIMPVNRQRPKTNFQFHDSPVFIWFSCTILAFTIKCHTSFDWGEPWSESLFNHCRGHWS